MSPSNVFIAEAALLFSFYFGSVFRLRQGASPHPYRKERVCAIIERWRSIIAHFSGLHGHQSVISDDKGIASHVPASGSSRLISAAKSVLTL